MKCKKKSYAKQAKNTGASGFHAGLPWRQFLKFFAIMLLTSFILNEIWEMAQMPAYIETTGKPWASTIALCTEATAGDVAIILGIYATGALAAGDMFWGLRRHWNIYAAAALMGLVYATLTEHAALTSGRWSYAARMPIVPLFEAGLWPLLQMTLLPPLSFFFARWWTGR